MSDSKLRSEVKEGKSEQNSMCMCLEACAYLNVILVCIGRNLCVFATNYSVNFFLFSISFRAI